MDIRVTLEQDGVENIGPDVQPAPERSGSVPKANPNHTPPRSIRVPDELWDAMATLTAEQGTSISAETNKFYARYVKDHLDGLYSSETPLERQLRKYGS